MALGALGGALLALARLRHQYDKFYQRWYLPKLLFWLSFSLEETAQREVAQ